MNKITKRITFAFLWSWLAGIACLFLALQFSPPRWSAAAMGGALYAAAESSLVYVLPPLLLLVVWVLRRKTLTLRAAALCAVVWVLLTVAWWASAFTPIPWMGVVRNIAILLPGSLVPAVLFYLLITRI
ncbi:MAG: hypothetical protein V4632_22235 [Pseudomonadota bacterium]